MTKCPSGVHDFPEEDEIGAYCPEHEMTLVFKGPPLTQTEDDVPAEGIGPGPAVCEPCLMARLFDPDGAHHCTGATTAQTIGRVLVPSTPQPCPCACQPGADQP